MNNKFFFLIFFFFSKEVMIKDAVYNIVYKNYYLNYIDNKLKLSHEEKDSDFRIEKISENFETSFYSIEHIKTNFYLIYNNNTFKVLLELINQKEELSTWNFIRVENNSFKIQNQNKCFLIIKELEIYCEKIFESQASLFSLIEIYEEVKENNIDNELIEKEPIDVLIKYIDLRDPTLNRTGIHQIEKDFDNEEIRYSLRSIIKNIPWVRKIFILMPNEKVRYFKDYDLIKEKIVYVKDKEILGYDSSNSLAFQFRYWKMKKFGITDNFIAMDDDCFIGHSLKKSDFFYVSNEKVIPALITSKFIKINTSFAQEKIEEFMKIMKQTNIEQSSAFFRYSLYSTFLFIINLFNRTLNFPVHTHNAIPVNIQEIKEIYDIINQSEYKYYTLDCLHRHFNSLQFQAFVLSYTFIKYKKKVNNISNKLIQNKNSLDSSYNYSLFCINTGPSNYSNLTFMKSKILMEYLFPDPSPYEIVNKSLSSLTFNTLFLFDLELKKYKEHNSNKIDNLKNMVKQLNLYKNQEKFFLNFIAFIIFFFLIYLKIINKIKEKKNKLKKSYLRVL